jgi:hypothetical protein
MFQQVAEKTVSWQLSSCRKSQQTGCLEVGSWMLGVNTGFFISLPG